MLWFLREEHILRVFEKRVLRRIFGPKRDEVTEDWRKLNNEELHNFYSSSNIITTIKSRRMRWGGHVARMWETRNACRILVGKPEDQYVGGWTILKCWARTRLLTHKEINEFITQEELRTAAARNRFPALYVFIHLSRSQWPRGLRHETYSPA
jgi:hypothetical protein